jgi:hypothetical protein
MRPRSLTALTLALALGSFGCSKIENPVAVPISSILVLSRVDTGTLRADGLSSTTIRAQIPPDATTRTVTFRVIGATIRGGSGGGTELAVQAGAEGRAEITLMVGTTP